MTEDKFYSGLKALDRVKEIDYGYYENRLKQAWSGGSA
jgi:hypothetical protein